jgi:hypothetical protein
MKKFGRCSARRTHWVLPSRCDRSRMQRSLDSWQAAVSVLGKLFISLLAMSSSRRPCPNCTLHGPNSASPDWSRSTPRRPPRCVPMRLSDTALTMMESATPSLFQRNLGLSKKGRFDVPSPKSAVVLGFDLQREEDRAYKICGTPSPLGASCIGIEKGSTCLPDFPSCPSTLVTFAQKTPTGTCRQPRSS